MSDSNAEKLMDLAGKKSLLAVVMQFWLDRELEENQLKMVEILMTMAIDHRAEAYSAAATIEAAESGQDVLRSVEAGVSKIDESHGGAIEGFGRILQEDERAPETIVSVALTTGKRLPGLGHRMYKDEDPRTTFLFSKAQELGLSDTYIKRARDIEAELEKQKGKKLVINIDGAMAVVLSELGIKPELMNAFFLWPRVAGLVYRWNLAQRNV